MTIPDTHIRADRVATNEIPPYQGIDLLLGKHTGDRQPRRGFCITSPDAPAVFAYNEEEAAKAQAYHAAKSKWPHAVICCRAWIHKEGDREYWTPR